MEVVAGYAFFTFSSPPQGDSSRSLLLPVPGTEYSIHIHHWIYLLGAIPVFLPFFPVGVGFCVGGIIQSFTTYSDSFTILRNDTHELEGTSS
jgi:hypothetical protein